MHDDTLIYSSLFFLCRLKMVSVLLYDTYFSGGLYNSGYHALMEISRSNC